MVENKFLNASNQRFVSPPVKDLLSLRQPLTPGEIKVFKLFNNYLGPQWEIYIQPYFNGLRPDFVLLNPNVGVAVFEVKDWDLSVIRYGVDKREGKARVISRWGKT